jgi:hypothetical protein
VPVALGPVLSVCSLLLSCACLLACLLAPPVTTPLSCARVRACVPSSAMCDFVRSFVHSFIPSLGVGHWAHITVIYLHISIYDCIYK